MSLTLHSYLSFGKRMACSDVRLDMVMKIRYLGGSVRYMRIGLGHVTRAWSQGYRLRATLLREKARAVN
ncbi:hypothetical protein V5O48_015513 [Marasmius crinis-equi]|uniref:Uncharacterized protein n=1 Tax=Marasmius crinis-equi TaxID=585013 RepID=A0ABR3EUB9_9AGAR